MVKEGAGEQVSDGAGGGGFDGYIRAQPPGVSPCVHVCVCLVCSGLRVWG